MLRRSLANLVAIIHGFWLLAVATGVVLTYFFPDYWKVQITLLLVMIVSWVSCGRCPFTIWENALRQRRDPDNVYSGSCISHYVRKFWGWEISRAAIRIYTFIILLLSVLIPIFSVMGGRRS